MGKHVAQETVKLMIKNEIAVKNADVLILGITFKENCPDVRNTKVVDIISTLQDYDTKVVVYDPWANPEEVQHEYGCISTRQKPATKFDAVILAVAHDEFENISIRDFCKNGAVVYDVKGILEKNSVDGRL
jgi:UDP-N-acetyl-D-galactosamine dehydrogenase